MTQVCASLSLSFLICKMELGACVSPGGRRFLLILQALRPILSQDAVLFLRIQRATRGGGHWKLMGDQVLDTAPTPGQ